MHRPVVLITDLPPVLTSFQALAAVRLYNGASAAVLVSSPTPTGQEGRKLLCGVGGNTEAHFPNPLSPPPWPP